MITEKQIHEWLLIQLANGGIARHLQNYEQLKATYASLSDASKPPIFSIDYFARKKTITAAWSVLQSLRHTELIASDKNISGTKGEILRPDIMLFNPEENSIIIIEIKKDKHTAREAITELLAYEQAAREFFPHASNEDIKFVLVAAEWKPLLDHAVANVVTVIGKHILALEVTPTDADAFSLRVRARSSWRNLESLAMPRHALPAVTLSLAPKFGSAWPQEHEIERRLHGAIEMINREGERGNGSGFALLWRDDSTNGGSKWNITIVTVNLYSFLNESLDNEEFSKPNSITEFIRRNPSHFSESQTPPGMMVLAMKAYRHLEQWFHSALEDAVDWKHCRTDLAMRGTAVRFGFWGQLGDFVREHNEHQLIHFRQLLAIREAALDWRDSLVVLPVLDELTGDQPLPDGLLTAKVCFDLGIIFGTWLRIEKYRRLRGHAPWAYLAKWADARLVAAVAVVGNIYAHTNHLDIAPPELKMMSRAPVDFDRSSVVEIGQWIRDHFIKRTNLSLYLSFNLGVLTAHRSNPSLVPFLSNEPINRKVAPYANRLLRLAKEKYIASQHKGNVDPLINSLYWELKEYFRRHYHAIDNAWEQDCILSDDWHNPAFLRLFFEFVDTQVPPLYYPSYVPDNDTMHWDWLRYDALELFAKGEPHPCVILCEDGSLVVGPARNDKGLPPIINPEWEVYLWLTFPEPESIERLTWDELIARAATGYLSPL